MFLTWRLAGTLPSGRVFPQSTTSGEAFVAMDRLLDRECVGPVYLRRPNNLHLLVTLWVPVSQITHPLKRFTARQANRMLHLIGKPFWQDESYDRFGLEFQRIVRYTEANPVNSGLVATPEEYLWSSARPIDNRPQVGNLPHISNQM